MKPIWHDGPLSALAWDGMSPVAWSVADTAADTEAAARATADDLADAARARDGAARLARRRLARALIAQVAGLPAEDVRIARSAAGAPTVVHPGGWHLSLSGRDGHALIAVAPRAIAVDREPLDDAEPLWDMLTVAEASALRALPRHERAQAWLRRWTIKEAHAKLVGEPRRIAPAAIETIVHDANAATATFEDVSHCTTRVVGNAIETLARWRAPCDADRR